MSVLVSEDFKRGFILDEERIRKVADLLKERFEKSSESYSLQYSLHREDGLDFQTDDVQQVISEQNTVGQRIRRLDVKCRSTDFKVSLTFDSETGFFARGVQISIEGTDRDSVYLMASELREYIRTGPATGTTRTMPLRIAASVLVLVLCFLLVKTLIHLMRG